MSEAEEVKRELASLQRGRGVRAPGLAGRVGPRLRAALHLGASDDDDEVHARLIALLRPIVADLSSDLRKSFLVATAISTPEARHGDRLAILATEFDRDLRTVRRRVAAANAAVAEVLVRRARPVEEWIIERADATADLRLPRPVLGSHKTICAIGNGQRRISERFGIPQTVPDEEDVEVEITAGGTLTGVERLTASSWRYTVELDRELQAGETHDYAVEVTIPGRQYLRPYLVMVPLRPTRSFTATLRVGDPAVIARAWRLDGFLPAVLDDLPEEASAIDVTETIVERFTGLEEGRGYGVRWEWLDPA